jgi:hypothetical protein
VSAFLRECKASDPAPRRQLGLPAAAVEAIAKSHIGSGEPKAYTTGSLVVIAFFFLLRVGEYTPGSAHKKKRTVPLQKKDVQLWCQGQVIANDSSWETLLTADAVTISLENQKNGQKGTVLHHDRGSGLWLCPVRAMCRLMHVCRGLADDTSLGTFRYGNGQLGRVTAFDVRSAIRSPASQAVLTELGYDMSRVGTHSLRSGGAIALKLAGQDSDVIKKLGRWSSNTYLIYIQSQIAQLTVGVARKMARQLRFHVVG